MPDSADPQEGWANNDILATSSGIASSDLYGKLYYHVKKVLRSFLERLSSLECIIQLASIDARVLPDHLQIDSFARIDVGPLHIALCPLTCWVLALNFPTQLPSL